MHSDDEHVVPYLPKLQDNLYEDRHPVEIEISKQINQMWIPETGKISWNNCSSFTLSLERLYLTVLIKIIIIREPREV